MLVALAVVVLTGTAIAEWLGFPAPLLLIVVGVAASYLPMTPEIRLSPEIVLVGLLPAREAARTDALAGLRSSGRAPLAGPEAHRARGALVVAVFGFALVRTVVDAQRAHRSKFLDLTTTTSISRTR